MTTQYINSSHKPIRCNKHTKIYPDAKWPGGSIDISYTISIYNNRCPEVCTILNSPRFKIPVKAKNYIDDVCTTLKSDFGQKLVSMVLFGGVVEEYFADGVSDVDLIVVLADTCSKEDIKKARTTMKNIEIKYNFSRESGGIINRLLQLFNEHTGMFTSHFVCKKSSFENANFNKMFLQTIPFFIIADLIVPKRIVLTNVFGSARVIYGDDLLQQIKISKCGIIDLIKDCSMNFVLSWVAIGVYPFSNAATKYSMQAMKWSFLACKTYLHEQSTNLDKACRYFMQNEIIGEYSKEMFQLRGNYKSDIHFVITTPLRIIYIHLITMINTTRRR